MGEKYLKASERNIIHSLDADKILRKTNTDIHVQL